jgi:hypothetical protein
MSIVRFTGKISGDGECFAFEVDEEVFKEIAGEEEYQMQLEVRNSYLEDRLPPPTKWLLYPSHIFGYKGIVSVCVETKLVEEQSC